jgi:hypothetical protein
MRYSQADGRADNMFEASIVYPAKVICTVSRAHGCRKIRFDIPTPSHEKQNDPQLRRCNFLFDRRFTWTSYPRMEDGYWKSKMRSSYCTLPSSSITHASSWMYWSFCTFYRASIVCCEHPQ